MTRSSGPSNRHGTLQGGARGRKWWAGLRKGRVGGVEARLEEDKWRARRLTIRRRGQDQVPGGQTFFWPATWAKWTICRSTVDGAQELSKAGPRLVQGASGIGR